MKLPSVSILLAATSVPLARGKNHSPRNLYTPRSTCEITGFSLYSPDMGLEGLPSTLDLTDYTDGKINIIANVDDDCVSMVQCVKLSFAGNKRTEKVEPYALYGDINSEYFLGTPHNSGEQILEATAYPNNSCSGTPLGHKSVTVDVIPTDTPIEGEITASHFSIVYEDASGPATEGTVTKTCEYIEWAIGDGMLYKSDISLADFSCIPSEMADGDSLTIEYEITAAFKKSDGWNPYINRLLPTQEEVDTLIDEVVGGERTAVPGWDETLLEYLREEIPGVTSLSAIKVINSNPFTIVYETSDAPSNKEEMVTETCEYIRHTIGSGMLYKADVSLTEFACVNHEIADAYPLMIEFEVTAEFKKDDYFNPYVNRPLPTTEEMDSVIERAVDGEMTAGHWAPPMLVVLQSSFPELTGISLA